MSGYYPSSSEARWRRIYRRIVGMSHCSNIPKELRLMPVRRQFDSMANKYLAMLAPLAVSPAGRQQL